MRLVIQSNSDEIHEVISEISRLDNVIETLHSEATRTFDNQRDIDLKLLNL